MPSRIIPTGLFIVILYIIIFCYNIYNNKFCFLALRIVLQVPDRNVSVFLSIGHPINIEECLIISEFLTKYKFFFISTSPFLKALCFGSEGKKCLS
jgi:hypothetical protein